MNITEFAEERGVASQAVSMYIRRHSEEFENHLIADGKQQVLDEVALELLDKQYPKKLELSGVSKEEYEALRKELKQKELLLAQKESLLHKNQELINKYQSGEVGAIIGADPKTVSLLEVKNLNLEKDCKALRGELDEEKALSHQKSLENERIKGELNAEIARLQSELALERGKTWVDKLFKK